MPGKPTGTNLSSQNNLASGLNEFQLHPTTGLRIDAFDASIPPYTPGGLGLVAPGATSYTGFGLSLPITNRGGTLPFPQTPILSLLHGLTTQTRTIQARLRGIDQFGNTIEEITPVCTSTAPAFLNVAFPSFPAGLFSQAFIFCSKVFSQVLTCDLNGSGLVGTDIFSLDYGFPADRCRGLAAIFSAGNGANTFTLTIVNPGGVAQTTGNIAANATAATVATAVNALTMFANGGHIVQVQGAGSAADPWILLFPESAPRDQFDITANLVTAPNPFTVTGFEYFGHDNLGLGLPRKILAYRPDISINTHPDLIAMSIESNLPDHAISSPFTISAIGPGAGGAGEFPTTVTMVTVTTAIPLPPNSTFAVYIVGANGTVAPNGFRIAQMHPSAATKFSLPLSNTVAGNAGTVNLMPAPIVAALPPAGTAADPVGSAGYRLGVNATDLAWQGYEHKVNVYLDSSRAAAAHLIPQSGSPPLHFMPYRAEQKRFSVMVRSSAGTGPRDMASRRYPR
jgi:hypothetical protein